MSNLSPLYLLYVTLLMTLPLSTWAKSPSSDQHLHQDQSLIFYDQSLDLEELIKDSAIKAHRLGEGHPLEELTTLLSERKVQTLHLVAHGDRSGLYFGEQLIDIESLDRSADWLSQWAIQEIALWSCDVGQNRALIKRLEELTGATVWSSPNRLGHAAGRGAVESRLAGDQQHQRRLAGRPARRPRVRLDQLRRRRRGPRDRR